MTIATIHAEERILAMVHERGHILLEPLLTCLPDLTWNQVFLGVDALSRQGAIRLRRRGYDYEIWMPILSPNSLFEGSPTAGIKPTALTLSR